MKNVLFYIICALLPGCIPLGALAAQVSTAEELMQALPAGGTIQLTQDITLNTYISSPGGAFVLDGLRPDGGVYFIDGNGPNPTNMGLANNTLQNVGFRNFVSTLSGGAIGIRNNVATVLFDNVTFENNQAGLSNQGGGGLAAYSGTAIVRNSLFDGNAAYVGGGFAVTNGKKSSIDSSVFRNNRAEGGGALYVLNDANVSLRVSNSLFENNQAYGLGNGGAAYVGANAALKVSGSTFSGNQGVNGGAIVTAGSGSVLEVVNSVFKDNYASAVGGAVYLSGGVGYIIDSSFYNNHASMAGGAMAVGKNTVGNILAYQKDVVFSGNYLGTNNPLALSVQGTVNLNAAAGRKIIFNDPIQNYSYGFLNINAPQEWENEWMPSTLPTQGTVVLNAPMTVSRGTIGIYGGTLELGPKGTFFNADKTTLGNATLRFDNGVAQSHQFGAVTLVGSPRFYLDVDLTTGTMDTLVMSSVTDPSLLGRSVPVTPGNKLILAGFKLVGSGPAPQNISPFATPETAALLKDLVQNEGAVALAPVFAYNAAYDPATGAFTFQQRNDFNPYVLGASVSVQTAAQAHLDFARRVFDGLDSQPAPSGVWARAFGADGRQELKGLSRFDSRQYGALAGYETNEKETFAGMLRGVFYAGAEQTEDKYEDVKLTRDGGTIGAGVLARSGGFFYGLTADAGYSSVKQRYEAEQDRFNLFTLGASFKGGYDWLIFGNAVLQPNLTVSYALVRAEDFTNAYGAKVRPANVHALQAAPGLKLTLFADKAFQPYVFAAGVFNASNGDITADGTLLPTLNAKTYVQYGAGVQTNGQRALGGYAQALLRSFGRQSLEVNAGVNWRFGGAK